MTHDDLFNIFANIVKMLVEAVADNCSDSLLHPHHQQSGHFHIPNFCVGAEAKGVYDPKKLFGVTILDVVRANTFVAQKKNLKLIYVDISVVGGHAWVTILPLLSKMRLSVAFKDEKVLELTVRIQHAGSEVVEAKVEPGSATSSLSYAATRFVESFLQALYRDGDVYECAYVQSDLTDLPLFPLTVKLGSTYVEALISADLQGLAECEAKALEALKLELKPSIEKGVAFTQKQAAAATST